jgi:hypothetical protein
MSSSPFMTLASMSFFFIIYLCLEVHLVVDIILFCFCYTTIVCLPTCSTFELYFYLCFNGIDENTSKSCKRMSSVIRHKKKSTQTIIIFTYNDFILMVWSYDALKLEVLEFANSLFSWAYLPTFQYIKLGKENHKHHKTIKRKIIKDCFHVLWSMHTSIYISRFFSHETWLNLKIKVCKILLESSLNLGATFTPQTKPSFYNPSLDFPFDFSCIKKTK